MNHGVEEYSHFFARLWGLRGYVYNKYSINVFIKILYWINAFEEYSTRLWFTKVQICTPSHTLTARNGAASAETATIR